MLLILPYLSVVPQGADILETITKPGLEQLLREDGYRVKEGQGPDDVELERDGIQFVMWIDRFGETKGPLWLRLYGDYHPSKPTSLIKMEDWLSEMMPTSGGTITPVGDGSTVFMRWQADLGFGLTGVRLKHELSGFFEQAVRFSKKFQLLPLNAPAPQITTKLDDDYIVDFPDQQIISRILLDSGWTYKKAFGYSSPTWILPVTIAGVDVFIRPFYPERPEDGFTMNSDIKLPKELDRTSDAGKKLPQVDWAKVTPVPNQNLNRYWEEVSLAGGLRVKKIRERIRSYAKRIAALESKLSVVRAKNPTP